MKAIIKETGKEVEVSPFFEPMAHYTEPNMVYVITDGTSMEESTFKFIEGKPIHRSMKDASRKYAFDNLESTQGFIDGAKWQKKLMKIQAKEHLSKGGDTIEDMVAFDEGIKLGRELERKRLMKGAIESEVGETCGVASVWVKIPKEMIGQKVLIIKNNM